MKAFILITLAAVFPLTVLLTGCGSSEQTEADSGGVHAAAPDNQSDDSVNTKEESTQMKMIVQVGGSTFTAILEENEGVDALVEMLEQDPLTIQMRDYSGFEKVGPLGTDLPASNRHITVQPGDIVLYQGDQIVMFYGSNSWSYTRLGHIDDLTGWEEALGSGDVTVTFSLED